MIILNKAKCAKCDDVIESKHRHDFVRCKCGAIFVDGGKDYRRCGYTSPADFIDLSVTQLSKGAVKTDGNGK